MEASWSSWFISGGWATLAMGLLRAVLVFGILFCPVPLSIAETRVVVHELQSAQGTQRKPRSLHETLSPFTIARIEIVDAEIPEHETNESFGQKVKAEIDKLVAYGDSPINLPDFYGTPEWRAIVITSQGPSFLIERWDFVYRVLYGAEEWIVPVRGVEKTAPGSSK